MAWAITFMALGVGYGAWMAWAAIILADVGSPSGVTFGVILAGAAGVIGCLRQARAALSEQADRDILNRQP